jgi:segregation and condensation protein B
MIDPNQDTHPSSTVDQAEPEQQQMPEVAESELPGAIVAMLFAASEPTRIQFLARTTGYNVRTIRDSLESIEPDLARLGLMLQWTDSEHVQIATMPSHAALIRRFLGIERTARLSPAALEVLAIIGYRQPVTRPEIDSIRGVDSSGVLQTLVARELIEPIGRLPGPGNPVQYGTTGEFLRVFGLSGMDELPELPQDLVDQLPEAHEEPLSGESVALSDKG